MTNQKLMKVNYGIDLDRQKLDTMHEINRAPNKLLGNLKGIKKTVSKQILSNKSNMFSTKEFCKNKDLTKNNPNIKKKEYLEKIKQIEKAIGYKFKNPELVINVIDPNLRMVSPFSYKRLGFLGDSCLDLGIMMHVRKKLGTEEKSVGSKSTLAFIDVLNSNSFLGLLSIFLKLDRFYSTKDAEIMKRIQSYKSRINAFMQKKGCFRSLKEPNKPLLFKLCDFCCTRRQINNNENSSQSQCKYNNKGKKDLVKGSSNTKKATNNRICISDVLNIATSPKVLSDFFEALICAVYIDSCLSMKEVQTVLENTIFKYVELCDLE
ncbi:hypothetical protein BB560_001676 [Smittium megazygosporum]|uniref:RNase III domain-containing protein n=1 Tax=Smittium megazygosporum TaxID=133381 RepID=A0A2T9ZGX1_9FUNG|nr:hypothetical protein BB560_001676 [Smittium megazygosporum]